ncbi:MFS transporter [uncultured Sphingomonas sp.]|uniref:MFS transporter n=1 Tax=uncultured Sphingomonas sp. TaxID=158754 RepID=UPI0025EDBDFF|nr:MFS transporter [uncultured Sphingomonas sp.]
MSSPTISRWGRHPLLISYASVHLGISLLWAGEELLCLYIMIRFLALPSGLAGGLFLASALANAVCDGLVGRAIIRFAWLRRAMPWLACLAILVASAGFAALPLLAPRNPWSAMLFLLVFRLGYSVADVPHNGLTRHLAARGADLMAARVRAIGSAVATLAIAFVAALIQAGTGSDPHRAAMLVGCVALTALALMTPLPFLLRGDSLHIEQPETDLAPRWSPAVWRFCAATMLGIAPIAATAQALLHIDVVKGVLGPLALLVATVARLGAIWLWSPVARRIGSRQALGWAYVVCGITALLLPWTKSMGNAVTLLLAWFGLGSGGVAFLSWAVLTDAIKRDGQSGAARFTAAFSVYTMATKIALGLAALLVGIWLSSIGVSTHADPHQFLMFGLFVMLACSLAGVAIAREPAHARSGGFRDA